MLKKEYLTYILLVTVILNLYQIQAELEISTDKYSLEMLQGDIANVTAIIKCVSETCDNILTGIKIPNLEKKYYNFSQTNDSDCFGGTCLTKPEGNGPLYNIEGNANWGCGKCLSTPAFSGQEMRNLVEKGCVSGMKNIVGVSLCLETNNKERWDIIFKSWPIGGTGDFVYERSMERGIIKESDNPFSLVSSNNPQILNMNSGSEKQINFQLKATGQIGTYDLVIFASEKESKSIEIEIKPEPAKTENIEREQTKKHYEEISNTNINNAIVKTNPTQYEEFNQGPTKITADVISDSKRQPIIKIILIFSSIIFLALLILVVYLRKKDKMYIQA